MTANNKISIGALLWGQSLFLGSTFDTWVPVIAATLLATLIVYQHHRRTAANDWPENASKPVNSVPAPPPRIPGIWIGLLILVVLVACLFWRLENQADAEVNLLSVGIDVIAHWGLFSSLLIWGSRPNRCHFSMLALGMLVLLFGVAGGGTSRSMAAQTSIALAACIGFTVANQIIQGTARGNQQSVFGESGWLDQRTRWMTRMSALITVSLILMTSGLIANATNLMLPGIQQAIQKRLSESLDSVVERTGIGGTRYVRSGRLGAIRQHMTANPNAVALGVDSKSQPGYLRGRVYDSYRRQRWGLANTPENSAIQVHGDKPVGMQPSGPGKVAMRNQLSWRLSRFDLPTDPNGTGESIGTTAHLTVYNNPAKGYVVFAPLATRWIEARARQVLVREHNVIGPGIDITKPYVAGVANQPQRCTLNQQQRAILTEVPVSVRGEATAIASAVCPTNASARIKANAVSRHFQSEWDYSLRPTDVPQGIDPVAYFLRQQHPAHCEFFASAAAIVLRAADVPTRYVTGYIVDERDEEDDEIWVARNQDAHAWVEAYDERTQRWFAVEATPGRTYQSVNSATTSTDSESLDDFSLTESVVGSETLLGKVWVWLVSFRATDALMVVYQFAQLPLFLFLVGYWWYKFRRTSSDAVAEIDRRSFRMLRQVDRKLRRRSLVRSASETLFQFADRIDTHADQISPEGEMAKLKELANWYRTYASARYRGIMPKPLA